MKFLGNDTVEIKDGRFFIDGYDAIELAEKFGTPLYVMSEEQIKINYNKYIEAFKRWEEETGKEFIVAYAYKANANLAITKLLSKLGCGADVVSGGELYIAKLSNVPSEKIVFNGNCKTKEEIIMGIEANIRAFNVDSISELILINETAKELGKVANVAFRINPNVDPKTHPKISTGLKKNKFGLDVESGIALKAIKMALEMDNVNVVGVHCHIGSQLTDVSPFIEATEKVMDFVVKLKEEGIEIRDVNLGGGLGIPYEKDKKVPTQKDLADAIINTMLKYKDKVEMPNLILEPGRSLVATAGYLLGRVHHIKETPITKWVMVDAGMNDMMRPAMYDAYHHIINCKVKDEKEVVSIAGGLCESSDVFGRDREIDKPEVGDVLAIFDVGAYGISMANNYNARGRPRMVLTSKKGVFLIRERESYADLIAKDIVPPHLL
ncbi:diaminopimelate decarboxylase [Methanocaldococcus fervens]|uniref:Diaminopimelate decarboxylase n=1 Tax=Methanocaldococcus fervens (strain DSM 4213 / JCM 15782 / AG86) TaxID=573064 RepID=C7P7Q9_METFA|nr:diaminopimelate decarboxylase [Methanocaldococcus fervens]ACV24591.1 diaminopimelate decarboxylase [Methanocaldococcus fervens AG86]